MNTLPNTTTPLRISLMACGELRDALTAIEEGKTPAAVAALMAIDPASWQGIEKRLTAMVGNDLRALLVAVRSAGTDAAVHATAS
ncbi:hypothetical protein [Streptomyces odontomachi]|uniref:hypothetical protein n=1 Tax=Streptomyces odontomachi TaxID=2944940 RepID=UPI00210D45CB|nr:hypothetical protein [Streptomyces sp. ODS25]